MTDRANAWVVFASGAPYSDPKLSAKFADLLLDEYDKRFGNAKPCQKCFFFHSTGPCHTF